MNQKLLRMAIVTLTVLSGVFCEMDASIRIAKGAPSAKPKIKGEVKRESARSSASNKPEGSPLRQLVDRLKTAQSKEILKILKDIRDMLKVMTTIEIKSENGTLCRMFDLLADAFPRVCRHGMRRYEAVGVIVDIEKIVVPKLAAMPKVKDDVKKKVNNLFFVIGRSEIRMPKQSPISEDPKEAREQKERAFGDLLRKVKWTSFVDDEKTKPAVSEKKKQTTVAKAASRTTEPKYSGKRSKKVTV